MTVGDPKYKHGDIVAFDIALIGESEPHEVTGRVAIVDAYGTFFDDSEVYYDIFLDSNNTLVKHIKESAIKRLEAPKD